MISITLKHLPHHLLYLFQTLEAARQPHEGPRTAALTCQFESNQFQWCQRRVQTCYNVMQVKGILNRGE